MKTKKEQIKFKVGDVVSWGSQAGGYHTKKEGKVLLIVPPGDRPHQTMLKSDNVSEMTYNTHAIDPRTLWRKEESYIIEVPAKGKGKPRLYWPLLSSLALVK